MCNANVCASATSDGNGIDAETHNTTYPIASEYHCEYVISKLYVVVSLNGKYINYCRISSNSVDIILYA